MPAAYELKLGIVVTSEGRSGVAQGARRGCYATGGCMALGVTGIGISTGSAVVHSLAPHHGRHSLQVTVAHLVGGA